MILDMNIKLNGIDEDFLEEFDELIEETRVEYFIINPISNEEVNKTIELANSNQRFKYTLPLEYLDKKDKNCVAIKIEKSEDLNKIDSMPVVIESSNLNDNFIDVLNSKDFKGVVLNAKESDNRLEKFAYSISHDSLKDWTKRGIYDTDYNKIALQSDYPDFSYDDLLDGLLKDISDLTFRAEQTIAAGGTRTVLKTFKLL